MAGIRYASVLPVPVPASASSTPPSSNRRATAAAISVWPERTSKSGIVRASGPSGANTASTRSDSVAQVLRPAAGEVAQVLRPAAGEVAQVFRPATEEVVQVFIPAIPGTAGTSGTTFRLPSGSW